MSHINKTIGILGGGQLGRMLMQEAINLNLQVNILDPDLHAPCKHLCQKFTNGSLTDYDTVYTFGKECDLITIEIENVNIEALEKLESEGKLVYPQPKVLKTIKDKGLQKEFYRENNIPTAPYFLVSNKHEIKSYEPHFPFAHKLRTGGYDGKGVELLRSMADFDKAFDAPSVLEKLVDIKQEISVIIARNESGQMAHFPPVEMEFNPEANLVEFLFSPANITKEIESRAVLIAKEVAEKMGIIGLLAVEMFVDQNNEVLVNEVAPRPHNSGHQSIEGNYTSQYEQHWRAILNLPLGDTSITFPSVMVNILGEKGYTGEARYEGLNHILSIPGVFVHLYGKRVTKPYRKMGHVTVIDKELKNAKSKALEVKNTLKVISK
jgi:5-(carboxyamino)imidazole ribonucleotide synthase